MGRLIRLALNQFQFHYGSIKGYGWKSIIQFFSWFQFHYGSIKGEQFRQAVRHQCKFQFHYGSIKGYWRNYITYVIIISIPLWFD